MAEVKILKQEGHHFLWIDGHMWMWDIPIEKSVQKRLANEAFGDVLVAGYGLGIVQEFLLKNPKVTSVLTVEKLKEVIEASKQAFGQIYGDIEINDFHDFNGRKFDCVIGDIWEDILPEHLPIYLKFKESAQSLLKPNGKVLSWGAEYFEFLIKQETND